MKVDTALTGQINAHGLELHVRAEPITVAANRQLWSHSDDQSPTNTVTVEKEITERMASALKLQFARAQQTRLEQR